MSLGSEYEVNRYADPTYYSLGMRITNAQKYVDTTLIKQPGTGQRRLVLLEDGSKLPGLTFTGLVQRLDGYITAYAFIDQEGTLPAHNLRYTDGVDLSTFTDCLVDSCELHTRVDGPIEARFRVPAKTFANFTPEPTWESDTEKPMIYADVSTVKIGTTTITNWEELACRVRHNVIQKALGNVKTPSIVKGRQIEYSGLMVLSRASASKLLDIYNGMEQDAVYEFTDHQTPTPVTKTFTFEKAKWKVSRVEVPGTDIEWERLEWEAKKLLTTP